MIPFSLNGKKRWVIPKSGRSTKIDLAAPLPEGRRDTRKSKERQEKKKGDTRERGRKDKKKRKERHEKEEGKTRKKRKETHEKEEGDTRKEGETLR